jgi:pentatricopeptide repeat protein
MSLALLDSSGLDVCSDDVVLVAVLEACIKQRQTRRVKDILKQFEASQLSKRAAMHTHAVVIKAYGVLGQVEKCREVWSNLVDRRALVPSCIASGCMLDALVCNHFVDEAVALLHDIKRRGATLNSVMYSTVIKGFDGRDTTSVASAMQLFDELCAAGMTLCPKSYSCMIHLHARAGAVDQVIKLVEHMKANGCKPNDIINSMVMKSCCVAGKFDFGIELLHNMLGDCHAQASAYNTLLGGCINADRMDLAEQLVAEMESGKTRIEPTCFTLLAHVKYYGRTRRLDDAFKACETWASRFQVIANASIIACLIRACVDNDAADRVRRPLQQLRQSGQPIDEKCYASLIVSCVRASILDEAAALAQEADAAGIELSADARESLRRALTRFPSASRGSAGSRHGAAAQTTSWRSGEDAARAQPWRRG